jgi:putative cardiolipin synthase
MVIDHRHVFIGSMNFDPRSRYLNTEMGVIVDSPGLAQAVEAFFEHASSPANAFHVVLAPRPVDAGGKPVMQWIAEDEGVEHRWYHEPDVSAGKRLKVQLLRLLPIEGLL